MSVSTRFRRWTAVAPEAAFVFFELPDDEGRVRRFDELAGGRPLVVSLNRGHWCSYCGIELEGLQEIEADIAARSGSVPTTLAAYNR